MPFTPTPLTGSQVGIIYSTGKLHMRQHIYVEDDSQWAQIQANLPAGCSLAFVPMSAHLAGHDTFHQAIATAIGVPTAAQLFTDPRCVVVDNVSLTVEQVILADDSIDTIPGKTLINHAVAAVGHTYNPTLQQFTAPASVLPPKAGVRATAVNVPAQTYGLTATAV